MTTLIERTFNILLEPIFWGEHTIEVGEFNEIGPWVTIGTKGQHRDAYPDHPPGKIVIGNHNIIREFVTIQRPVITALTQIGNHCFIMAHTHIPHDACIDDYVTLSPGTMIGGHAFIMHHATVGLNSAIHQHRVVGSYTMLGMGSIVTHDIPPFAKYYAMRIHGVNRIGMQRNGFSEQEIQIMEDYYRGKAVELPLNLRHEFSMFEAIQARWKI